MQRELITFQVGGQFFGLDIMSILEIRAWSPVTKLPKTPEFMAGVVNLRGIVVPVFDLSQRLGWEDTDATPRNPIIVSEWGGQARGLIVDSVEDIVSVDTGKLQRPDAISDEPISAYIEGLVPIGDNMVAVIDLGKLLHDSEMLEAA